MQAGQAELDKAAAVAKGELDKTLAAAGTEVDKALATTGSEIDKSLVDAGVDTATLYSTASAAAKVTSTAATQTANYVTATDPAILALQAAGLVALYYFVPPLAEAAVKAVRGYDGRLLAAFCQIATSDAVARLLRCCHVHPPLCWHAATTQYGLTFIYLLVNHPWLLRAVDLAC